ncbi:MAG TPA: ABC transporter ATP-binding protein [Anaerolineales bacterium]|nr:ABC transporter ATP-binding protein [Anaerolineales bacterium]
MSEPLLSIRRLTAEFTLQQRGAPDRVARALEDVSFDMLPGQTVGLVGESGCGKTTTLLAAMRLLPANGRITSGEVRYKGKDLLTLSEREMREYRWKEMSIVFQGAMNALNPVMKVGDQIAEAITLHHLMDRQQVEARVIELLELVGIPRSRRDQYPHQYSGGMRQRAMIAMALACKPSLLFADEPTTALDVMIQAQVLELLRHIQQTLGLAIVLVTHDLGVVAEVCDSVVVMYGGKVAECGTADQIYNHAQHPYTQRLLASFPDLERPGMQLASIPGTPPRLTELPSGCRFSPRCDVKLDLCMEVDPPAVKLEEGHVAACHLRRGKEARSA